MSIEKRFVTMLDDNIEDIRNALEGKANIVLDDIMKRKLDMDSVKELKERKEKLNDEINNINIQIDNAMPKYTRVVSNYNEQYSGYYGDDIDDIYQFIGYRTIAEGRDYPIYKVEAEGLKELSTTKEYISMKNFNEIAKQTRIIFNMAATNKEARNILMTFQSKNWNALGVELPALNPLASFDINNDGTINMKALNTPIKK